MNPTFTNNFNRYKNHNHNVDVHRQTRLNPVADLNISYNQSTLPPLRTAMPQLPTLTATLNREILSTLKHKEKEFVDEVNYYQGLNRHGLPKETHLQLTQTLGQTRSRFVRGESYAQEAELAHNRSMGAPKQKQDFLDRFITRQNNWQGYYKNQQKLEALKCDKHPGFLANSEFLPANKENEVDVSPGVVQNLKKSKLLPNSVVIDRNVYQIAVDKQWSKNYSGVLNNQKVLKDVHQMDLNNYSKLTRRLQHEYVHPDERNVTVDPELKGTILSLYNQA